MERHAHACTQTLIRQFVPSGGVEEQGGKNGIVPLTRGMTHCMRARVLFLRMSQQREHGQEGRMQGKQAKIVSPAQEKALLGSVATTRYPARDRVMLLLSMKAGLRAKAIASLTWAMVTDAPGQMPRRSSCRIEQARGRPAGAPCRCAPTCRTLSQCPPQRPERRVLKAHHGRILALCARMRPSLAQKSPFA